MQALQDPGRDDLLILVDGLDRKIGTATKLEAHLQGLLHRAFSVVLMRESPDGPELLLAKRALGKYHSGGLWTNSCCSHPRDGEETIDAAYRRVEEELGIKAIDLHEIAAFAYRAEFDNGLCEYEYDHVLLGQCTCTDDIPFDPSEVSEVRWVSFDTLAQELAQKPKHFTAWAPMVFSATMARGQDSIRVM
ncbi:MAG: isopentenyl-diphosphate Delta-isomerase [Coriobacteriales bacterium]|nr:isopentenyl-diphosphate Delta-isomerase [Coriobacteriales bacterium]